MNLNTAKSTNFKLNNTLNISIICLLNILFFLFSYDNPWTLQDFGLLLPVKLFNLINGNVITFEPFYFNLDFSLNYERRYLPLFDFFNQFMPDSNILFHLLVVVIYALSSILVYLIALKILGGSLIPLIASVLFTLNYSVSIKMLSWNLFYHHILSGFFGFLSIYIFIYYLGKKKLIIYYAFVYVALSCLSFLTSEIGLVFPILNFLIIVFFLNNSLVIRKTIISIFPIFIFIFLTFLSTGKFIPILQDRIDNEPAIQKEKSINPDGESKLYFDRSTYAYRNTKTYTLRAMDNLLSSVNLSSLEKVLEYYDNNNLIKTHIKKNYTYYYLLTILFILIFLFFLIKEKCLRVDKIKIIKLFLIFLIMLLIYTVVYFRRDINLGISFSSALLISYILKVLIINKSKNKIIFILSAFLFPSILYFTTSFEYTIDFYGHKSQQIEFSKKIIAEAESGILNHDLEQYYGGDYKYLFYYKNYKKYEKFFAENYKGLSFSEVHKKIIKEKIFIN